MKCSVTYVYWFLGIVIFCIDRITKNAALMLGSRSVASGIPCVSYELTLNRGISWGMFHSYNDIVFVAVSLIIACVIACVAWWAYNSYQHGESILGHACIIAGSLSNSFDRICYQGVIDFIVISYRIYYWPLFNVADMAIVVGIGIIVWQNYCVKK